jgi:hypothetical protein
MAPSAAATYQSMVPGRLELEGLEVGNRRPVSKFRELPAQFSSRMPSQPVVAELTLCPGDAVPTARPDRVLFGALKDPRLRVAKPIPLDVSRLEGQTIVSWRDVDESGSGETLCSAIEDFEFGLRALYRSVFVTEPLRPDSARIRQILAEHIASRPA